MALLDVGLGHSQHIYLQVMSIANNLSNSNTAYKNSRIAINMVSMSKRRILSPEESEAARRLLRLWNEHKSSLGLTQEKAAIALGYNSQGAVNQYLHGTIPLGLEAVIKWAKLLGVSPEEIRPDMKSKFVALGPVIARSDHETIELSRDELAWVQMLRQLSPEEQRVMRRAVAALAKQQVDDADAA